MSLIGTYVIRRYSIYYNIMDVPNDRSSHTNPTPRGGGLAIILVFYIALIYFQDDISKELFYALLWAIPIALISILDDIYTLSSKIRFLVQVISSVMAIYSLGGISSIDFLFFKMDGVWLNILALISILWLTNLYNFLDGIDGYAASEAITVGLGIFLFFQNPLGLVLAVTSLGFLVFNWHKASIFMGDVGSATLGFIFAVFVFSDMNHGNIYIWMILLSLFWFDATVTLVRRFKNNEKLTKAHKKHAYQRLIQSGWSHSRVVSFAIFFNFLFLTLLYLINAPITLFVLNVILMLLCMKVIDNKRGFE